MALLEIEDVGRSHVEKHRRFVQPIFGRFVPNLVCIEIWSTRGKQVIRNGNGSTF